jgi:hypothetical protein
MGNLAHLVQAQRAPPAAPAPASLIARSTARTLTRTATAMSATSENGSLGPTRWARPSIVNQP